MKIPYTTKTECSNKHEFGRMNPCRRIWNSSKERKAFAFPTKQKINRSSHKSVSRLVFFVTIFVCVLIVFVHNVFLRFYTSSVQHSKHSSSLIRSFPLKFTAVEIPSASDFSHREESQEQTKALMSILEKQKDIIFSSLQPHHKCIPRKQYKEKIVEPFHAFSQISSYILNPHITLQQDNGTNNTTNSTSPDIEQGEEGMVWWVMVLQIVASLLLVMLSALFSGLTLGLVGFDRVTLQILSTSGTPKEQKYAKRILPLREKGNFLLCTLLIGNVMVNAGISILTSDLTSGIYGFLISIFFITFVGEIIPQSICNRHALVIGAHTFWIVYIVMFLLFIIAFPISKILDCILGSEIGTIYSKKQLLELVKLHGQHAEESGLAQHEVAILGGALAFSTKTVKDIMTPIERAFVLNVSEILNAENLTRIWEKGHSRIPVYRDNIDNIIGLLFVKDLLLIDPEQNLNIGSVMSFYGREVIKVNSSTHLDEMLKIFKSGKSHLCIVVHQKSENDESFKKSLPQTLSHPELAAKQDEPQELLSIQNPSVLINHKMDRTTGSNRIVDTDDSQSKTIGLVTLEDIIEEIINDEIQDESDIQISFSSFSLSRRNGISDISSLGERDRLSEPQVLAVTSFLTKTVRFFQLIPEELVSAMVRSAAIQVLKAKVKREQTAVSHFHHYVMSPLNPKLEQVPMVHGIDSSLSPNADLPTRLQHPNTIQLEPINQDTDIENSSNTNTESVDNFLYRKGEELDKFVLILSGRIEVLSGQDNFVSEYGQWSYLGIRALSQQKSYADFDARIVKTSKILVIDRQLFVEQIKAYANEHPHPFLPTNLQWINSIVTTTNTTPASVNDITLATGTITLSTVTPTTNESASQKYNNE